MKKVLIGILIPVFALVLSVNFVSAQTTEEQVETLQSQIDQLLLIVEQLQTKMNELKGKSQSLKKDVMAAKAFVQDLSEGMTNEDIKDLQALLSAYPEIYPEGIVSGYFGPLTKRAVQRFQERLGISTTGYVGPQTRAALSSLIEDGTITAEDLQVMPFGITNARGLDKPVPPGILKNLQAKRGFASPLKSQNNNVVDEEENENEDDDEEETEDEE